MKNKVINFLLIFVVGFSFISVVNADDIAQAAVKGIQSDSLFNSLKSEYDKGVVSMPINQEEQPVIVYGHSVCTTSGCEYTYQGVDSPNVEDLLSSSIVCSDGSTSINYSLSASTADAYKSSTYDYDHEVYWSEIYTVTCAADGDVTLGDSDGGYDDFEEEDEDYSADDDYIADDDYTDDGGSDDSYGSATPGDSVDTGVETYYIILIVVAIVSYIIMKVVKKHNLFKNI